MYKSWLIRRPFLIKNSFPPQPEAKKQVFWIVESMADKEPQKRVHERRAPYQPWFFFRAPYQLMKRFSPQNGRFGPNFWKTFEDPSQKHPGSLSVIRVLQKDQHFGKNSSVLSKVYQKFVKIHGAQSAERTTFSRYDAKKRSVPQKEFFSAIFQNLHQKTASEPQGQIAQRKTSEKRPKIEATHPHETRVAQNHVSIYHFFGVLSFLVIYVLLGPLFLMSSSFVIFSFIVSFPSSAS